MVVDVYKFGNTIVEIHDTDFVQTQDEVDLILTRIAAIAQRLVN